MAQMSLRRLGPEPWGVRLRRARDEAEFTVRQVEEILFPHVSKSGVVRLEACEVAPTVRKDRGRAALILILLGYELEDFELSADDLPPAIDLKALQALRNRRRGQGRPKSAWVTAVRDAAEVVMVNGTKAA